MRADYSRLTVSSELIVPAEGFLPQQVIQVSSTRSGADLVLRDANNDGRLDITLALTQPRPASSFGGTVYNRASSLVNLIRQP